MTYAELLPASGSTVRFSRVPTASWAQAGEAYRVEYRPHIRAGKKGIHANTTVYLWNEAHDCGTFDNACGWANAQWEVVQ